jgi:hypothetical protein
MQSALGKWYTEPWDVAAAIKKLVEFENIIMVTLGSPVNHDKALEKLRALGSFEHQITTEPKCEPITQWVTAPNHEKALERLRALRVLKLG